MNWSITSTATIFGNVTIDDGVLRTSAVAKDPYEDADGNSQERNLTFYLAYKAKNVEEVAEKLSKGSRIGFEGYFTGSQYIRNEAEPSKVTVSGPTVYTGPDGEPYTALAIGSTKLYVIAPPVKALDGLQDVTTMVLWGFLGKDAEQMYTPTGRLLTKTSLAHNRYYYQGDEGNRVKYDVTTWWDILLWTADEERTKAPMQYWKKGQPFIFKGTPQVENVSGAPNIWQTNTGENRASYAMNVARWTFAPSRRSNGGSYQASDSDYSAPLDNEYEDEIPF